MDELEGVALAYRKGGRKERKKGVRGVRLFP